MHKKRILFLSLVSLLLVALTMPAFAAGDTSTVTFTAIEKIGLSVNDFDFASYGDGVVYIGIKNNHIFSGTETNHLFQIIDNYNDPQDLYPIIPEATVVVNVDASGLTDWTYNNDQATPVLPDDEMNLVYRSASYVPSGVTTVSDTVLQTAPTTLFTDAVPGYYGGELGVNLGFPSEANAQVGTPITLNLSWTARVN